ncbi:uncharacterized protein LOC100182841 [Ciona intestinalis]
MIKHSFLDVCVRVWEFCHNTDDENLNFRKNRAYLQMKLTLWNYSDKCYNLCKESYKQKTYLRCCMKEFSIPDLDVKQLTNPSMRFKIKSTFGYLFNCVRLYNNVRLIIREKEGVNSILNYYQSTYLIVKANVMLILAFCVDEEENEKIITGTGVLDFIIKLLLSALASSNHVAKTYAFSATETVMGLDKLAMNDNNKVSIVNAGVLPLLGKMLEENGSKEEHNVATHCLWTLSFHKDNKDKIRQEPGILNAVYRIQSDPSSEPPSKRSCEGILFILDEQKHVNLQVEMNESQHVMISYQWDVQPMMLQVRDKLKENKFKVWIDVDRVEGSILSAMADAVENASVVVVAMSEKYKNSNPCRTEAEYAYKLQKPIVPLLLDESYKPDGWLGALVGMQIYFNFSDANLFEANCPKMLKTISSKVYKQPETNLSVIAVDAKPLSALRESSKSSKTENTSLEDWGVTEVSEWAKKTKIDGLQSAMASFDGVALMQLNKLMQRSPDIYYSSIRNDLKLSLLQILHLTSALEQL